MSEGNAIGVDIGGTKILTAIVDETGSILEQVTVATPDSAELVQTAVVQSARTLLTRHEAHYLGVAAAGLVEHATGRVRFAPHISWREEPLRDNLAHALRADGINSVTLDNDANAALWAEWRFGAARGREQVLLVTVGTGIGGAVMSTGQIMRGSNGMAGEFGHIQYVPAGRPCQCGLRGCWEQYASGRALSMQMQMQDGGRVLAGEAVMRAAHDGDREAQRAFSQVGQALGLGLADLIAALDPELILIGGGVSMADELLLGPTRSAASSRLVGRGHRRLADIAVAALGPAAGVIGAADLARGRPA